MSLKAEWFLIIATVFLAGNVLFLNVYILKKANQNNKSTASVSSETEQVTTIIECDDECQKKITESVLQKIPTAPSLPSEQLQKISNAQEFIIPLGTGKVSSKEWQEVIGAEAEVDTAVYPGIQEVVFESFVSIPTANGFVHVKLFNVTDKHDVWFSESVAETNAISKKETKVQLEKGKKLYRVHMKSTLGYEAVLHNSRLKIRTK